jgi:nitric oxide reductase subunit B
MRMFGDSLFAFGAMVLGWFVLGLVTGHSFEESESIKVAEPAPKLAAQSGD